MVINWRLYISCASSHSLKGKKMYILPLSFALNLHTRNMKMAKKIAPATEINVITRVDNFFPPPIYKRRSKKRSKNMSKLDHKTKV